MPRLVDLTPLLPAANLTASIAFFEDVLGFETRVNQDGYAYLKRDDVAVRLLDVGGEIDTHDPARQIHCYIDVEDLDGLYQSMKPELDKLPPGRVRAPFDTDYGQREFHVTDPDALLISFGAAIR